ncbi:MAG: response regulator [Labilithrix sp.]
MEILLCIPEESLATRLTVSLREAGHSVGRWSPGDEVAATVGLLVIVGLDDVVAAHDALCDVLAIVDEEELELFAECPREITDFCLKSASVSEIAARIRAIASRPPWRDRIQQRLLAVAVESAGDVIEISSPDLRVEYVNAAYEKVLGYSAADVTGQTPAHLSQRDEQAPELLDDIEQTLARGQRWTGVLVSRAKDGRLIHLESAIAAVTSAKGEVTHRVAVKRDITERLARQEALLEANRALSEARDTAIRASRAKSEFLANMSHELRTPLNAVIGYSEMLLEEFTEGQTAEDLTRIHAAGQHLLSLINDVLDISKIEAEKVELVPDWFGLTELVTLTAATARPLAQKNDNQLALELAPDLGQLYADQTRLRQVVLNLLSNACKFTKNGVVTVRGERIQRNGAPWVELTVIDTGIGISPEQQARLFQPFVQADSSTTREFGGTGLGLAICKRLVEMMGGEISLESAAGVGTTMRVRLPRGEGPSEESAPPSGVGRATLPPTVLLIDDDPTIRDLFTRLLGSRGFRPHVAATGHEGIAAATQLEPDAIVLDVKMPGLTGWEVLSALKLSEATQRIPVIMLTFMQQPEIGQALGAVDYLMKPINPAVLVSTLRRHTGAPAARVLLVEDDEPTRTLMRRTLEADVNTVFEAENGQVALDRLAEADPDIIVLDLMMPVMDGFTFLEHFRRDPRFGRVPVVVATARTLSDDERRTLETTVQRVIEKTACSRTDLLDAIGDEIHQVVGRRPKA